MFKNSRFLPFLMLVIVVGAIIALYDFRAKGDSVSPISANLPEIGQRTKTANCQAKDGLPDRSCTPGAVFKEVTKDQICTSGYSSRVRDVSLDDKRIIYDEYGIKSHKTGEYEVDHLIPLELGGSNDYANLFPEAAEPYPGYHEKDAVENYLHDQMCKGIIDLHAAELQIAFNWIDVFNKVKNTPNFDRFFIK